jgi:hypothetical protein
LPNGYSLRQFDSDSGDVCHHNIQGVSDKKARKLFVGPQKEGRLALEICDGDAYRLLTPEDIDRLLADQAA